MFKIFSSLLIILFLSMQVSPQQFSYKTIKEFSIGNFSARSIVRQDKELVVLVTFPDDADFTKSTAFTITELYGRELDYIKLETRQVDGLLTLVITGKTQIIFVRPLVNTVMKIVGIELICKPIINQI